MNNDYAYYEDSAGSKFVSGCLIAVGVIVAIPVLWFLLLIVAALAIRLGSDWEDMRRHRLDREVSRLVTAARAHPEDNQYTQRLLDIARRENSYDASLAAEAVGGLGEAARPIIPEIAALLKDDDRWVRMYAARSLAKLGPISKEALPELISFVRLGKADDFGMEDAIEAIARTGKPGVVALPMLRAKRKQGESRIEGDLKHAIEYLEALERGDVHAVYDDGCCCRSQQTSPPEPSSSEKEVLDESHSVLEG